MDFKRVIPLCPSPLLASSVAGCKSLIVKQTVHLNTFKSFGQRTIESQVMHLPVFKSLSGTFCLGVFVLYAAFRTATGDIRSSSVESKPDTAADSPWRFFPENSDGNGWLIERP